MTAIIPEGGSTGMSHEHCPMVEQAAQWLAEHRKTLRRAIVPELRERFGLSILEAVEAAALAARYEFAGGVK